MFASLFRRGGVWYLRWKEPGDDRPRKRSLRTQSERAARAELRLLRERLRRAEYGDASAVIDDLSRDPGIGVTSEYPARSIGWLAEAFVHWAESYYLREDGTPTGELDAIRAAVVPLKALYGHAPASGFGPVGLKRVRSEMIARGWVRSTVNRQIRRVRMCFRWGVENELVPASVLEGLRAVAGLRRGRSEAPEADPVRPVSQEDIDAVLPHVSRQVRAMIELQLLTGARPGEVVSLRPCDIDVSSRVWVARPPRHKTAYRGIERCIYIGPRAQRILRPFLDRPVHSYLFEPVEAESERVPARRGVGVAADEFCGRRKPGARYTVASYRRAVRRACEKVNRARMQENPDASLMEVWSPNQLRHNAATLLRKRFGLEVAQVVLGHQQADVTQVYAEADRLKAVKAMEKVG